MQPQEHQEAPQPVRSERPYRSHIRPACLACRRRKSRCQTEALSDTCVTCRAHRTECIFPNASDARPIPGLGRHRGKSLTSTTANSAVSRRRPIVSRQPNSDVSTASMQAHEVMDMSQHAAISPNSNPAHVRSLLDNVSIIENVSRGVDYNGQSDEHPLELGSMDEDHHNMHIVGPAVTNDSQVLSDYLSGIPGATRSTRIVIPESASRSRPVLFTMVQKRPVGLVTNRSPSAEKLVVIEKILEPYIDDIINEFFKVNECMPLLDELSFRNQYYKDKSRISPALLACLYAHTLVYWPYSPILCRYKCPDSRFIWNLANEAAYSELYLSPGMSIIKAILLNIGGRPTTSIIGNGVLLGSAVSMAHSLGLNHNPLPWKIPQSEKYLRMKIWWSLLLNDRWLSLAHGTPPHVSRAQYDVPLPTLEYLCEGSTNKEQTQIANVFIALVHLTEVLDQQLQHVYDVGRERSGNTTHLELALNSWVESLTGSCRLIIIRGSMLDIRGAVNLRLAYLTTRLLLQRMELESDKHLYGSHSESVMNRYMHARHTSEEILILLQELQAEQLGGFWLPVTAFAFPATVNFLLRCALETESSLAGLAQSGSFRIARDIVTTLRGHQTRHGWDLADICIAQHADIVDRILSGVTEDHEGGDTVDIQEFVMPDASILDQYFPSLWDPLQNAW